MNDIIHFDTDQTAACAIPASTLANAAFTLRDSGVTAVKALAPLTPIAVAVEPLKVASMDSAEAAARAQVARVLEKLAAVGMDSQQYAPYPDSRKLGRIDFRTAQARYSFVHAITRAGQSCGRPGDPDIRIEDAGLVERYVEQVRAFAAEKFEAYVWKLNRKIGTVETATLNAISGVWIESELTVIKAGGTKEVWRTKMILNFSVYGKPFNQFPTRLLK